MYGYAPSAADEVTADITRNTVARVLYLHGPCSANTVAAKLEERGEKATSVGPMLAALESGGLAYRRAVAGIELWMLKGAGI